MELRGWKKLLRQLPKFILNNTVEYRSKILELAIATDDLSVLIQRVFADVFGANIRHAFIPFFTSIGERQIVQAGIDVFLVRWEINEHFDYLNVLTAEELMAGLGEWRKKHVIALEQNLALHRQLAAQAVDV
jgi:hypothetical protein